MMIKIPALATCAAELGVLDLIITANTRGRRGPTSGIPILIQLHLSSSRCFSRSLRPIKHLIRSLIRCSSPSAFVMSNSAPGAEAELEAFRQQWREEVLARNKKPTAASSGRPQPEQRDQRRRHLPQSSSSAGPASSTARPRDTTEYSEEVEPKAYHDLPDKEEALKLGIQGQDSDRRKAKEPSSALEHYERAVEKETHGQLGDSIQHYRKAFKVRSPTQSTICVVAVVC